MEVGDRSILPELTFMLDCKAPHSRTPGLKSPSLCGVTAHPSCCCLGQNITDRDKAATILNLSMIYILKNIHMQSKDIEDIVYFTILLSRKQHFEEG